METLRKVPLVLGKSKINQLLESSFRAQILQDLSNFPIWPCRNAACLGAAAFNSIESVEAQQFLEGMRSKETRLSHGARLQALGWLRPNRKLAARRA